MLNFMQWYNCAVCWQFTRWPTIINSWLFTRWPTVSDLQDGRQSQIYKIADCLRSTVQDGRRSQIHKMADRLRSTRWPTVSYLQDGRRSVCFQPRYAHGLGSLQFSTGASPVVSRMCIYTGNSLEDTRYKPHKPHSLNLVPLLCLDLYQHSLSSSSRSLKSLRFAQSHFSVYNAISNCVIAQNWRRK